MTQKSLIVLGILAVFTLLAIFFLLQCNEDRCVLFQQQDTEGSAEGLTAYDSEKFGIRFDYPKTYYLETKELGDGHRGHFAIILTEDTEENRLVREGLSPGREGPVAITFELFQSPETLDPVAWVLGHSGSNYKLSDGTYKEMTLGEKPAVFYSWDGLYRADSVALSHRDFVALISVTYIAPEDLIRNDFAEILKTVEFY